MCKICMLNGQQMKFNLKTEAFDPQIHPRQLQHLTYTFYLPYLLQLVGSLRIELRLNRL